MVDALRNRYGRGRRNIGFADAETVDPSAIRRLLTDATELTKGGSLRYPEMMGRAYRPLPLLRFLASLPDLPMYLRGMGLGDPLQGDLLELVADLREG
jgi:hypothetical protein